ncbi:MAG TPA: site-specific integrase [Candidatus Eisenbacteria bacterium]|nr:site-specific integrase [Candidatus Eisenbacteria bacterium]
MGRPVSKVIRVRVMGPLAPFAQRVKMAAREAGYTPLTTVNVMQLMAHLSRWLGAHGLGAGDLTQERVGEYLAARRAAGRRSGLSQRSLAPILVVLAAAEVLAPEASPVPASEEERLLAGFERHLLCERALAKPTTGAYVARARRFLAGPGAAGLAGLTAADVTGAVLAEAQVVSAGSAQYFVAALRAFLRFCYLEGLTGTDLAWAALAVTGRRRSLLPRGISQAEARALLACCDRRRAVGRRDYAVIVTLLRLGLRASEVAALTLDDIDWRAGEITVHGKSHRDERLPLPADVGAAIAAYLVRGRPASGRREVFLRATAPIGPLSRNGISFIVRRACRRAGIPECGAHRLRHTAACQMAEAGAPLAEIGQVLRHHSQASTANYARVNVAELRKLARPWPGGAA